MNQLNNNFHKLQKLELVLQAKLVHALGQEICVHGALAVVGTGTK